MATERKNKKRENQSQQASAINRTVISPARTNGRSSWWQLTRETALSVVLSRLLRSRKQSNPTTRENESRRAANSPAKSANRSNDSSSTTASARAGAQQQQAPTRRTGEKASWWQVIKETVSDWQEDKASELAAALAYYTAVSIAPLLVLIVVIVGFVMGQQGTAQSQLIAQLRGAMGEQGAQFLETVLENAQQPTLASVAGILSFLTLLWGSTNVFSQLQSSLNTIWEVAPKPGRGIWGTIKDRFLSLSLVLGVAFLLLVSLVLSSVLSTVSGWGEGILPGADWLWQIVNFAVSFAVIMLLFALIYKILPDAKIVWRDVWLGAAVTALLFNIGKFALGLYLANAGSAYGVVGSLVVFLLWVYYSAQVLFLGAEFTQSYARNRGSGIQPKDDAVSTA